MMLNLSKISRKSELLAGRKKLSRQKAFTLVEVIISVTIFSLFMGTAIGAYLSFHRAQYEAAIERSLMLEGDAILDQMTEDLRDFFIDYDVYASVDDTIESNTLFLVSPEGGHVVYDWNSEEGELTKQIFDDSGEPVPAYKDPLLLHHDATEVSGLFFQIFPSRSPYSSSAAGVSTLQYQPTVQIVLELERPGRLSEVVDLELQTSVTSRFYSYPF
jgi:prepilin-type N-terminal cleavage/methylation domain-containing protein